MTGCIQGVSTVCARRIVLLFIDEKILLGKLVQNDCLYFLELWSTAQGAP